MNERIRQGLDELRRLTEQVESRAAALDEALDHAQAERERLQQQSWRQETQLKVFHRKEEELDAILQENERLVQCQAELRGRLASLLGKTKALGRELRR